MTCSFDIERPYITRERDKKLHRILPQEGELGFTKNYRGITQTSIYAKVYNGLLLNRIEQEIEKKS